MTREEAIEIVKKHGISADGTKFESALRELIPELRESEDERIRKEIIKFIQDFCNPCDPDCDKWIAYLEKQKEQKPTATINGEPIPTENHSVDIPLAEWSEEDEKMLERAIHIIVEYSDIDEKESEIVQNWLKSRLPMPHTVSVENATKFGNLEYERGVKDGIQHAKNHQWKPSEEQMKALQHAIDACESEWVYQDDELRSLLNDLKKL